MADPFSIAGLIVLAVSSAASIGTSALARLFAPRPKVQRGKLEGDLFVQNSAYGQVIPRIYGADPDGKGGGVVTAGNVIFTSGVRKKSETKKGGKGPKKADVEEITYDVDLAVLVGFGRLKIKRIWANTDLIYRSDPPDGENSGVYDDSQPVDVPYDHFKPPSPLTAYQTARYNGDSAADADGVVHITSTSGNYASVTIYSGTDTQPPDPTIQAEVDAKKGAGSTPAFRGKCYVVFEKYNLSKYGGVVPNFTFEAEHATTVKTLDAVCGELCRLVALQESDFNFSNLDGIPVRGLIINSRQSPRQVMELLGRLYGVEFFEDDGVIRAVVRGTQTATVIPSEDLGAEDGPPREDLDTSPQLVDSTILDEPQIPVSTEIKYFDTRRDGESNLHREARQTVRTERVDTFDVPVTLIPREAQQFAQRDLYRQWVERQAFELKLPWKYAFLKPTDVLSVTLNGLTHSILVRELAGTTPAVLRVAGVADEISIYSPVGNGDGGDGYDPYPVNVPPQTICTLFNLPYLRPGDPLMGYYGAAAARGPGNWEGASLYKDGGLGFERIADFRVQAAMGAAVGALGGFTGTGTDNTNSLTVDLYNGTLESATVADVDRGANLCLIGNEVVGFETAEQVAGFPRRYKLTKLRRGLRETGASISTHTAGERFVLLDTAVVFIPTLASEAGKQRQYKAVTVGQTVDDAAVFTYTWDGNPGLDTDTAVPDIAKVTDLFLYGVQVLPQDRVFVQVWLEAAYTDPTANMKSVDFAEVTVFNKFGETVFETQNFPFLGFGKVAECIHDRRNADPLTDTIFNFAPTGGEAAYRIRLHNRYGFSEPVWYSQGQKLNAAPTWKTQNAHPLLSATPTSQTTTDLSWTYPGAEQLKVYCRIPVWAKPTDSTNTQWVLVSTVAASPTNYTVNNLNPNQFYEWRLVTATDNKESNVTAVKTFEGTASSAFPAPTSFVATALNSVQVNLTWTRNTTENTATEVWRNGALLTTLGPTVTSYTDGTVAANTNYTHKLRHLYGSNASSFTPDANVTTPAATYPAPILRGEGGWSDGAGSSKFRLCWVPNTNSAALSGFEVYRNSVLISTVGANQWTFNDSGLSPSTSYTYQVKNKFGAAVSGFSNSISDSTRASGNPFAPASLSGNAVSTTQVDLTWVRNSTTNSSTSVIWLTYDQIEVANSASVAATATSHSVTGLTPGRTYHFVVVHYENSPFDTSIYSNEIVVTVPTTGGASYPAPANLTANGTATNRITVVWSRNSTTNVNTEVYRDNTLIAVVGPTTTIYQDVGLAPGSTHQYKVRHVYPGPNYSEFTGPASGTTNSESFPSPSNLSGSSPSPTQIDLTWTRNTTGNSAVQVYRNGSLLTTLGAAITAFSDAGLSPNTTYTYSVRNDFSGTFSAFSNEASVTTQTGTQYPAPSNLMASATSITSVSVNWTRNTTTNTAVELYRDGILIATLGATTTTYTDNTVVPATMYRYKARNVFPSSNFSAFSNESSVTTPADGNFPAPSGLSATAVSGSQINLAWTRNATNNTAGEVWRSLDGTFYSQLTTLPETATSYQDTGLNPSTTHYYQVRNSFGGVNFSAFSNVAQATTPAATTYPPPTNVQVNAATPGQVNVTWNRNTTTNMETEVWRSEFGGVNNTRIAVVSATATSYADTSGVPGTIYYYSVRHTYTGPNYSAFAAASGSIQFPSAFPPPTNLSATATSSQVALTWNRNTTANTETEIHRDGILPIIVPGTQTTYTDLFVLPNETHTYTIRHRYGAVVSAFSNEVTVTTPNGPYPGPTNFTANAVSDTRIDLAWTRINTANTGWELYRNGVPIQTLAAHETSYSNTGLTASTSYTYKLRTIYAGPNYSAYTPDTTVTTLPPQNPAPTNLRVTALDSFLVGLAWNRNATNNTKVQVHRKQGAGGTYSQIADLQPAVDTYTDTSVVSNTTYFFKVRNRFDGGVLSEFSNEVQATMPQDSGGL